MLRDLVPCEEKLLSEINASQKVKNQIKSTWQLEDPPKYHDGGAIGNFIRHMIQLLLAASIVASIYFDAPIFKIITLITAAMPWLSIVMCLFGIIGLHAVNQLDTSRRTSLSFSMIKSWQEQPWKVKAYMYFVKLLFMCAFSYTGWVMTALATLFSSMLIMYINNETKKRVQEEMDMIDRNISN